MWGPIAPAEGVRRISDLLARAKDVPPLLRARALRNLAGAAHQERNWDMADPAYEESLRLFVELGDARGAASVRTRLAYRAAADDEHDLAVALLEESQRDARGPLPPHRDAERDPPRPTGADRGPARRCRDRAGSQPRSRCASPLEAGPMSSLHTLSLWLAFRRGDLDDAERHGRAALAISSEEEHAVPTTHQRRCRR